MVPGVEGGVTKLQPAGMQMSIYDAAIEYAKTKTPLMVIAGQEYGTGSAATGREGHEPAWSEGSRGAEF